MKLTYEQIEAIAHRTCADYKHCGDIHGRMYAFDKNTLQQFVDRILEASDNQWRLIEEAIMGHEYLVNRREGQCVAYLDEQGRWHYQAGSGWYLGNDTPTHWQPLPEPPTR